MQTRLIEQVRDELGPRAAFPAAAISHYLAAAVTGQLITGELSPTAVREEFHTNRRATIARLVPRAECWLTDQLGALLAELRHTGILPSSLSDSLFNQVHYLERIVHLAIERLLVNPAAPPLLVSPLPEQEVLRPLLSKRALAFCFDHPLAITHELYPLWTDAYVHSLDCPSSIRHEFLGIHNSWIDSQGRAHRAILFEPSLDLFLETPLQEPLPIAAALLICQSGESHRALSSRLTCLGIPHLNSGQLATLADDKWYCFNRWKDSRVATPPTCLLSQNSSIEEVRLDIHAFIEQHAEYRQGWVIQPRYGTEGFQVSWTPSAENTAEVLLAAWRTIAAGEDAILRPRVGLVGLQSADGPRPFDLRLHVLFDGIDYCVPSGYLQVARTATAPISSIAGGGQIQPLSLLTKAEFIDLGKSTVLPNAWTSTIADAVIELAKGAVLAVGPLEMAGLDIKLDYREGRFTPCVLDLNPRPAGLLYANLFASGEAGIGSGLWRRLLSLARATKQVIAT